MTLLDTDTLSFFFAGHPRVGERFRQAGPDVGTTIVSRIEVLEGRFAFLMKAADGGQLLRAQQRLRADEALLATVRTVLFDPRAAAEFDRLRQTKKLKKIGRGDLLIASIAMANQATLATRNLRHFRLVPGLRVENWID